jgi:hypothetical protein
MLKTRIKRDVVVNATLAFWLIATFIVAISPRIIPLNLVYGVASFLLLLFIVSSESKEIRSFIFTICMLYCVATVIPLVLALMDGRVSVLYYWILGLNTLLAVKCMVKISMPSQVVIARSLITICFLVGGLVASGDRADIDSVSFLGGSSNLLSAALIAVVCWYCFVRLHSGHKEPILVPLSLFVFAIYLGGRSGIVISIGILLTSILFRASRSKISLITISLILPLIAWFFLADVFWDLVAGTRLRHGFEDDIRTEMIQEYIHSIGPISFLIGGEFDPSGIIASYGGNPHNSIIRAHYMFGVVPIALFVLFLLISVARILSLPNRISAYGFALGGLILLRSYFDSVTFWFELDFSIVILLFSPILYTSEKSRVKMSEVREVQQYRRNFENFNS